MLYKSTLKTLLGLTMFWAATSSAYAQSVTILPSAIEPKLEIPKMAYNDIFALPNPKNGDVVMDTTTYCLRYYKNAQWICASGSDVNKVPTFEAKYIDIYQNNYPNLFSRTQNTPFCIDKNNHVIVPEIHLYAGQSIRETLVLVKYDEAGNQVLKKDIGQTDIQGMQGLNIHAISTDKDNNILITGNSDYNITFGNTTLTKNFVLKLDANGNLIWVKNISQFKFTQIATDEDGTIYLGGEVFGVAMASVFTLGTEGRRNSVLFLLHPQGQIILAKSFNSSSENVLTHLSYANNRLYAGGFMNFNFKIGNVDYPTDNYLNGNYILAFNKELIPQKQRYNRLELYKGVLDKTVAGSNLQILQYGNQTGSHNFYPGMVNT